MKIAVLTIGDEILIGQIVNTNAAWIGSTLSAIGARIELNLTVGDAKLDILAALEYAYSTSDVIITTGGLGPTHDDITKSCVAEYFGAELELDESILEIVRNRFEKRGKTMPPSNTGQALVPQGFEAIINSAGSAPALVLERSNKLLFVLPGVPHEMKLFMTQNVVPRLIANGGLEERVQKSLLITGIGESALQEKLEGMDHFLGENCTLAFLPNLLTLRLRITTTGPGAQNRLDSFEEWIRSKASEWIFGEGETTIEEVVGSLLRNSGNTLSIAESCSGGLVAHTITNVPGSSDYMLGGVVAYSNTAKQRLLGVNDSTLTEKGAVSKETACEMAEGAKKVFGATIGVSTTGILGPGGGTAEKPVGTVWIGIAMEGQTIAVKQQFGSDRLRNKDRVLAAVLNLIRKSLLKRDPG